MATYSITTTRTQEVGLKFSYDNEADKDKYPTQQSWLQSQVNGAVLDPMYIAQQKAMSVSFDQSFNTIPETSQPKARTEIETVITTNGGTVVPPASPSTPLSSTMTRVVPKSKTNV